MSKRSLISFDGYRLPAAILDRWMNPFVWSSAMKTEGTDESTDQSEDVLVELGDDLVATVEIRRPPNNFFDAELIGRLADACEALAAGGICRSIVLSSEGKHFSRGPISVVGISSRRERSTPVRDCLPPLRATDTDRCRGSRRSNWGWAWSRSRRGLPALLLLKRDFRPILRNSDSIRDSA